MLPRRVEISLARARTDGDGGGVPAWYSVGIQTQNKLVSLSRASIACSRLK